MAISNIAVPHKSSGRRTARQRSAPLATLPAQRFQPAHMGLGKCAGDRRSVAEMEVDAVAPATDGGDRRHHAIDGPSAGRFRGDGDDAALGKRLVVATDVDIMTPPVDAVDDEIVPVVRLAGPPRTLFLSAIKLGTTSAT